MLPGDGDIAYASRDELAEANAIMLLSEQYKNETVLLTGPSAVSLRKMIETVNSVTGRNIIVREVSAEDYVIENAKRDIGRKPESFFQKRVSWFEGVVNGDGKTVDHTLENVLGRRPKDGVQIVKELLKDNPLYSWKQNYFK